MRWNVVLAVIVMQVLSNGDLLINAVQWPDNMGLYYCKVHNADSSDIVDMFVYPVRSLYIYIDNAHYIAPRNDMPSRWLRFGHVDGAATWQMLLKRRRRLRSAFFRWLYLHTDHWVWLLAWGFISYSNYMIISKMRCFWARGVWQTYKERRTDGS